MAGMKVDPLKDQFVECFDEGKEPSVFFSPGRVCLIGEHIDYNGGDVLPAALSLGIYAVIGINETGIIRLRSDIDEHQYHERARLIIIKKKAPKYDVITRAQFLNGGAGDYVDLHAVADALMLISTYCSEEVFQKEEYKALRGLIE